jgi:hypothetical protein
VLAKSQFAKNTLEIRVIYLTFVLHVVLLEDFDPFWLAQHAANYGTTKSFIVVLREKEF